MAIISSTTSPRATQTLNRDGWDMSSQEAITLLNEHKHNTGLTELRLSHNRIDDGCANSLNAWLITHNITLLSLSHNRMGSNTATQIANALTRMPALRILGLGNNQIQDEGAIAIALALTTNTGLESLNLGSNQITDTGAKAIATGLKINTTLNWLGLNLNPISDEGSAEIANALVVNNHLETLNLSGCAIGVLAASALASALQANSSLQSLQLSGSIREEGDEVARRIAPGLAMNSNLTSLYLERSWMGVSGATMICEALEYNPSITRFAYYNVSFNQANLSGQINIIRTMLTYTTDRNACNSDRRWISLETLIIRAIVQDQFHQLPKAKKNAVYDHIWEQLGRPYGGALVGPNNVFRIWSMFERACACCGIPLLPTDTR